MLFGGHASHELHIQTAPQGACFIAGQILVNPKSSRNTKMAKTLSLSDSLYAGPPKPVNDLQWGVFQARRQGRVPVPGDEKTTFFSSWRSLVAL